LKRAEKEQLVEFFHDKFSRAKGIILTDFRGLDVPAMNELRARLREASIEYRVVKNTIMLRACDGTDVAVLKDHFSGPSAVALSYDDPVAPAKILAKFSHENAALELKAGLVDGQAVDAAGIEHLSKLPPREILLAQLLSVLNGPATSLLTVLSGVPRSFLGVLQAVREQKEEV
jgi:large subunit ribosomal protein L10